MNTAQLESIAQQMVAKPKGILAIDESMNTAKKRFDAVGVEFTEENRRLYRQLLITAPGINEFVSGYILFDETLRQATDEGKPFPEVLSDAGMLPGIKVDMGAKDLALHEGEKVTEGLDGLRDRLAEYRQLGAKFAKWRSVITIGKDIPSMACYKANAHGLARYAALVQEAGLVPMVEPEILIDGDHSIETCKEVSQKIWTMLFEELKEQGVHLPGVILKTSMVISGKEASDRADRQTVANMTVEALKETIPAKLGGIVFLSGGQGDEESAEHLSEMHKLGVDTPWHLSFSYGRAIQRPALDIWAANKEGVAKAQEALVFRAKMCSLATTGEYETTLEEQRPY